MLSNMGRINHYTTRAADLSNYTDRCLNELGRHTCLSVAVYTPQLPQHVHSAGRLRQMIVAIAVRRDQAATRRVVR